MPDEITPRDPSLIQYERDRLFWIAFRRALLLLVNAIEDRWNLKRTAV